jgi:hypothetical protein
MGFYDAFFGSEQSQYTAYAIFAAIIAICITILLTATDVPVSNRLLIVFFVIVSLVPSVFLTLFELTCIVTGGTEPNQWWCYAFAWVLAAFIIIYCIFIVIISLISLFTYNNAIDNVKINENNNRLSPEVSNDYAKKIIESDEIQTKQIEKFYANMNNDVSSMAPPSTNNEDPTKNKDFDPMAALMMNNNVDTFANKLGTTTNYDSDTLDISHLTQESQEPPRRQQTQEEPQQRRQLSLTTSSNTEDDVVNAHSSNNIMPSYSGATQEPRPTPSSTPSSKPIAQFSNYGGGSDDNVLDNYFSLDNFKNK